MALTSKLVQYDPNWPVTFDLEKAKLTAQLGSAALSIHHVGSTSIPGIFAKPEIDILVVVGPSAAVEVLSEDLVSLGYDDRGAEPGPAGHWYFSKNQSERRTHKLHLCRVNHPCIEEQLLFRDYLLENPATATAYSDLKLTLERENQLGISEYLSKKSPFISEIIKIAKTSGFRIH